MNKDHRTFLLAAVLALVSAWSIVPTPVAAHTVKVAYRCDPGGQVTFFAGNYHGDPGVFGSLIVDGTPYAFTGSPGLPGAVEPSQIVCEGAPAVVKWQSVTVGGLANGLHSINTTATSAVEDGWPGCFPADLNIQCPDEPDTDGDGIQDDVDNCPDTANPDQADTDGDGIGDACDACPLDAANDADADGVCGDVDNCPVTPNPDQADQDNDGTGDACDQDIDGDGVANAEDNCPLTANPGQEDFDGDGLGDACDGDSDNDGVVDADDMCPGTSVGAVVNDNGCNIDQLCPCASQWKNHGAYVSCVSKTAEAFATEGLITSAEKDAVVSAAAHSSCGTKK